jgi:hypothetical protein
VIFRQRSEHGENASRRKLYNAGLKRIGIAASGQSLRVAMAPLRSMAGDKQF